MTTCDDANYYDIGDEIILAFDAFFDGGLIDTNDITLTVKTPDGEFATLDSADLVENADSDGYEYIYLATQAGQHKWHVLTVNPGSGGERIFHVKRSDFA
jgi:hypothetical protein